MRDLPLEGREQIGASNFSTFFLFSKLTTNSKINCKTMLFIMSVKLCNCNYQTVDRAYRTIAMRVRRRALK